MTKSMQNAEVNHATAKADGTWGLATLGDGSIKPRSRSNVGPTSCSASASGAFGSDQGLLKSMVYNSSTKWHGRGHRFDPDQVHQNQQLTRARTYLTEVEKTAMLH